MWHLLSYREQHTQAPCSCPPPQLTVLTQGPITSRGAAAGASDAVAGGIVPAGTAQLAVSTKAPRWALCGAQQGSSVGSEPPSRLGCVHGAALPNSQDFPVHPSPQVQDPSVALHSPPFWQEQVCWQPSPYCCGWQPAGQGHSAGYSRKQVPSWDRRVPGCPAARSYLAHKWDQLFPVGTGSPR